MWQKPTCAKQKLHSAIMCHVDACNQEGAQEVGGALIWVDGAYILL